MGNAQVTARLYLTDSQIADTDRPAAKRTISMKLVDEKGNSLRGFQPTKLKRAKIVFGGGLKGLVATVKSSGSFSQEELDAKHRPAFAKMYEALSKETDGVRGYADVPAEIEMLTAVKDGRSLNLELGL
jgi:hypothetical protein